MQRTKHDSIKMRIVLSFIIMFIMLAIVLIYYYLGYRNSDQEQAQLSFNKLSAEITQQMDSNMNIIRQVSSSTGYYSVIQNILFSSSANEKVRTISSARELLAIEKSAYTCIDDIYLYVDRSKHLYSNTTYIEKFYKNLIHHDLTDSIVTDDIIISNVDAPDYTTSKFFYYLPISKIILDGTLISSKNDALCVILCNFDEFYAIPDEFSESDVTIAMIYKDEVINMNKKQDDAFISNIINLGLDDTTFRIDNQTYYANKVSSSDDLYFVCVAPSDSISINSYYPKASLYVVIIIGTIIIIIFLSMNTQKISSSIHSILKGLDRLHGSSTDYRLEEPKLYEFTILTDQINEMLDRLELSVKEENAAREKLYRAQLMQQNAEMIAYRNQINPHFLFNTLECMRSMAQYYHAEPIEMLVTAMAKMFRYSLYAKSTVPFSEEIDHVKQYLTVTNIRFPDYCVLRTDINPDVLTYQIPSMLLQPLIENSIKHAFNEPLKKQHIIRISAKLENSEAPILHITIIDNGCGMTDEQLEELKAINHSPETIERTGKDSIGIQNIYKRIKLLDQRNKLKFSSKYGYYTKVELLLFEVEK